MFGVAYTTTAVMEVCLSIKHATVCTVLEGKIEDVISFQEEREKFILDKDSRYDGFSLYLKNILDYKVSSMPYWAFYNNQLVFKCFVCTKLLVNRNLRHILQHMNCKCPFCGIFTIKSKCWVERHIESNHYFQLQEEKLNCPFCEKQFLKFTIYCSHVISHYRHACFMCSDKLISEEMFLLHLNKNHKSELCGNCFDCSLMYQKDEKILAHLDDIVKLGFVCNICKMAFHDNYQLQIHYKIFGKDHTAVSAKTVTSSASAPKENQKKPRIVLDLCNDNNIITFFKDILEKKITHDQLISQEVTVKVNQCLKKKLPGKLMACPVRRCTSIPIGEVKMIKHIQNHLLLTCKLCVQIFTKCAMFKTHMQNRHSVLIEIECFVCNIKFPDITKYVSHYLLHVHRKICFYCNEVVTTSDKMAKHIAKLHVKKKKSNLCETCGKRFKDPSTLKGHIETAHITLEKRNVEFMKLCSVCGKLVRKYTLHLKCLGGKKGSDLKEFICHYCSRIFHSKDHITRHILTHMDEKPFTCKVCGKGFNRETSLDKHKKDMHMTRKWLCSNSGCLAAFTFKSGLETHMRTCSKNDKNV